MSETTPVEKFFGALKEENIEGAVQYTKRPSSQRPGPIPFRFTIHSTERKEYGSLSVSSDSFFDSEAFEIYEIVQKDEHIFATGLMNHRV